MRILFDHGTPSGIARSLAGHEVTEAIERGWDRISNGVLLTKAEAAGFELLLTTDKKNPLPPQPSIRRYSSITAQRSHKRPAIHWSFYAAILSSLAGAQATALRTRSQHGGATRLPGHVAERGWAPRSFFL